MRLTTLSLPSSPPPTPAAAAAPADAAPVRPPRVRAPRNWPRPTVSPDQLLTAAWWLSFLLLVGLIVSRFDSAAQLWVGLSVMVLILGFRRRRVRGAARLAFLGGAAYLSFRYYYWRATGTIVYHGPVSFVGAIALFVAETYGLVIYWLGLFVNLSPLDRQPAPLPADPAAWPSVDVLVPTYNEPEEICEITLLAARELDYPKDKLRIYLCDDGGTEQRRADPNPAKAAAARERFERLNALCAKLGVNYLTRARNLHAKAGNINSALGATRGELILILDVDHVPTRDLLRSTTGWFLRDPKMFLVQTPHFFVNPDPIERNLKTFAMMPGENEMFYRVLQKGLDFWNGAFFCGSAAVLRRRYLEEVGGIAGQTITEDAETALGLHARGYHSAYIGRPMIAGLSPETYGGFIVQRMRWAQGMVQIFLLKNPLFLKGLKPWQRLCYFSSSVFWFFSYARVVFLLAPGAFLLFDLRLFDATPLGFVAYTLPHLVTVVVMSDYLYGDVRWSFVSELYELMQSLYCLPAIAKVFLNPRAPKFNVTPKGEQLDRDFISPLSLPFQLSLGYVLLCLGFGVFRLCQPHPDPAPILVTLGWTVFNLVLLLAAMGALFERRQRRANPRMPRTDPVEIAPERAPGPAGAAPTPGAAAPAWLAGQFLDLSMGGASVLLRCPESLTAPFGAGETVTLRTPQRDALPGALYPALPLHAVVRNCRPRAGGTLFVGLEFAHRSVDEAAKKVSLVAGDSEQWVRFQQNRSTRLGIRASLLFMADLGLRYCWVHFGKQITEAWHGAGRRGAKFARAAVRKILDPFGWVS